MKRLLTAAFLIFAIKNPPKGVVPGIHTHTIFICSFLFPVHKTIVYEIID